jgi:lysosomal acid lipase/cholesteryl ester hydrolase
MSPYCRYVLGIQRIIVPDDSAEVGPSQLSSEYNLFPFHSANDPMGREASLYAEIGRLARVRGRSYSDPLAAHRVDAASVMSAMTAASVRSGYISRPCRVSNSQQGVKNAKRPPVLLMHGLLQCSEAWLVGGTERSLACILAAAGFDVWCGNNRGNKYSQKHLRLHPDSEEFWNFSIDEFARYDLPAMVDYIREYTGFPQVAYIGFSQGSAQGFAALSLSAELNEKIAVFVAMSPALAVRGLARSPLTALVETDLSFIYLLFGRKRMLASSLDVQRVLSGSAWTDFLDGCLLYLFGWRTDQIDPLFKLEAFHHIYSFSSVKAVVHWFQIISSGRFAMFSDVPKPSLPFPFSAFPFLSDQSIHEHRVSPLYDTMKITTPIALFCGESDTLINIQKLVAMLPPLSRPVFCPSVSNKAGSMPPRREAVGVVPPNSNSKIARRRVSTSGSAMIRIASVVHDALGGWGEGESSSSDNAVRASLPAVRSKANLVHSADGGTGANTDSYARPHDGHASCWERQPPYVHIEPEWEHLDSMWATTAHVRAFPLVVEHLQKFAAATHNVPPAVATDQDSEDRCEFETDIWQRSLQQSVNAGAPEVAKEVLAPRNDTGSLKQRLLQSASIRPQASS